MPNNINFRLNGVNPLSYLGVNPYSPVPFVTANEAPTSTDSKNFVLGTIWLDTSPQPTNLPNVWMLVSLNAGVATWIKFIAGSGGGGPITELAANSGDATEAGGIINILGINGLTTTASGNTLEIGLANDPGAGVPIVEITTNEGNVSTPNGDISIVGDRDITTEADGTDVFVTLNNAITLGDITPIAVNEPALTLQTGDLDITDGNIHLPNTEVSADAGAIIWGTGGASTYIHNFTNNSTSPFSNFFAGLEAGNFSNTGYGNTMIGRRAGEDVTTGTLNTAVGYLSQPNVTTSNNNASIGINSLFALTTGLGANVALGAQALNQLITGNDNIAIGFGAGNGWNSSEEYNTVVGDANFGIAGEIGVVRIGAWNNTVATNVGNTFVGYQSGNNTYILASAISNTCLGTQTGFSLTTGSGNTLIGANAGVAISTGGANTLVGDGCSEQLSSGNNNTIVGNGAGDSNNSGSNNCVLGSAAMVSATAAASNCIVGRQALNLATTCVQNVAIGNLVLDAATSSTLNTSVGYASLGNVLTGNYNTVLGQGAGSNYTGSESSNILIGHPGIVGENNALHIGNFGSGNGQINACYIASVYTSVVSGLSVLVASNGQIGTATSSAKFKENIQPMLDQSSPIYDLNPVTFNYKEDTTKERRYGLIAESVLKVMPDLVAHDELGEPYGVKYQDLPVMLLNEIKKLRDRIEVLEAKLK